MRAFYTRLPAALIVASSLVAATARADACFDASDEARALLGRRRLLEARAQLRLCAASSCDETVRVLCDERLTEVTARLPTILFDVKDDDGHDLDEVTLSVDGAPYAEGARGAEITLDPGPHVFVFALGSDRLVERRFILVEREKGRREHVVLERRAASTASAMPPARDALPVLPASRTSAQATAGWITLGAAAVGLGIGTAFGISAIVKNDDASCNASNVCEDPRSRHDARSAASISTVSFIVGGLLAATGLGLVVFSPKAASRSGGTSVVVASGPLGGSLGLTSTW